MCFTLSTKREIRQFHFVIVQRRQRQRKVQNSVMHVQSFFFIQPVCLFAVLVAVRRRRCLSSLSLVTVRARSGLFLFSRIFSDHNAAAERVSSLYCKPDKFQSCRPIRISLITSGLFEHCFSIRVSLSFPEVVKVIIPCCKILRNK